MISSDPVPSKNSQKYEDTPQRVLFAAPSVTERKSQYAAQHRLSLMNSVHCLFFFFFFFFIIIPPKFHLLVLFLIQIFRFSEVIKIHEELNNSISCNYYVSFKTSTSSKSRAPLIVTFFLQLLDYHIPVFSFSPSIFLLASVFPMPSLGTFSPAFFAITAMYPCCLPVALSSPVAQVFGS